jgi:hypothetical protein
MSGNLFNHAAREVVVHMAKKKGDEAKGAGIVLMVIGLLLTPVLIGIPIVIVGAIKFFSARD